MNELIEQRIIARQPDRGASAFGAVEEHHNSWGMDGAASDKPIYRQLSDSRAYLPKPGMPSLCSCRANNCTNTNQSPVIANLDDAGP